MANFTFHPEAERLCHTLIRDFWHADREIKWKAIEQEHSLWLSDNTLLVGRIDAQGVAADGLDFTLELKSASKSKARNIELEKTQWRMNPQALTYGVLTSTITPHFTVRWALKTEPATTAFEWYSYTPDELMWWRGELINIAKNIRRLRGKPFSGDSDINVLSDSEQWPTNLKNCTRYGEAYKCPFRDEGCWALNFNFIPPSMQPRTESHLEIENRIRAVQNGAIDQKPEGGYHIVDLPPDLVVLDATRVDAWIGCSEYYRRMWEGQGLREDNENLKIGGDLHTLYTTYLAKIKAEQEKGE